MRALRERQWVLGTFAAGLALVAAGAVVLAQPSWLGVAFLLRTRYAAVPHLPTRQLAAEWLAGERPVLLDVRSPEEFAVSHLAGARRVDPGTMPGDLSRDTPVVAYCSVGLRSAALVERLRAAGYPLARNLEGSLFGWANEGRPLVDAQGNPTTLVHPYNARWGKLLAAVRRFPADGGDGSR